MGYSNQPSDAKAYKTMGSMFVSVGGEGTWKLGDLKMSIDGKDGGAYEFCTIQFLDPTSSKIDTDKVYTYYGVEDEATAGEDDGWYTYNKVDPSKNDRYANDDSFPAGTAFLCNFDVAYNPTLIFAGQVLTGDITIDSVVNGVAMPYMFVVNPIPANLTLASIKMIIDGKDGGAYEFNTIQFLDPTSSKVDNDRVYTYYGVEDEAEAGVDDGWYTYNKIDPSKNDRYANEDPIGIGEGFLCNFDPIYEAKLLFKNPVK